MLVVGGVGGGVGIGYEGADFGLSMLILHKKSNICVVGALCITVDDICLMHTSLLMVDGGFMWSGGEIIVNA